jgi:hypothetical protein
MHFMTSEKKNKIDEPAEAYEVTPKSELTSENLHPVLVQLLEKSIKEIEEGKTSTHEEVMKRFREKFPLQK